MTLFGFALTQKDERQSGRYRARSGFWYRDDAEEEGQAKWCSVAEQGACICIGRYLQPGRELVIHGNGAEIYGRIVWCRPMADRTNYVAGVRVLETATDRGAATLKNALHSA